MPSALLDGGEAPLVAADTKANIWGNGVYAP